MLEGQNFGSITDTMAHTGTGREHIDRHVRTKQRAPSNKEMVRRCEAWLKTETDPAERAKTEQAIAYWKGRAGR